ncbi:MAG: sulfurtransferase [Anaerolineae bacterium]
MTNPLVSTDWLAAHLDDPAVRVIDTRWYLLGPDKGREEYARAHIPGAVFLSLDADLAAPVGEGPGRHPLPTSEAFATAMGRAGIGDETHVVAYDDVGGGIAGRLWWLLRYFGHDRVSLLDGGIAQWLKEGRPLTAAVLDVRPATLTPRPHPEWVVDQSAVAQLAADPQTLLLDVRAPERYRGETEPVDSRAGHIPGAKNAPLAGNLRGPDDLRLRDPDALRERFHALGADGAAQVVVYCGSGVNACQNILALQLAGYENVLLYEGSWSDWSRNPARPAATGEE